jgi:6-phosphofructokinase 1
VTLRLGVLISGGDAPGMNAAVVGVCEAAEGGGAEVLGCARGYQGVSTGEYSAITASLARRFLHEAGTWLGSSRHPEMRNPDGLRRVRQGLDREQVGGLAVIGGGGSLAGARAVSGLGVPGAFVPAPIDNDIPGTEATIGMDSAVNDAVAVIDQLRVTGRALPGRAFVVETLGGDTDHLAVAVAAAAGLGAPLLSLDSAEITRVAAGLPGAAEVGEAIVVMSEGIGDAVSVAAALQRASGVRVHPTILGHAQRAARPSARDLALGFAGGRAAAAALLEVRSAFIALGASGARAIDLAAP